MKILLISSPFVPTPPPTYGGTQRDVAILGEAFASMGHEITIIASKKSSVPGCRMVETLDWSDGQTFADVRSSRTRLYGQFWGAVKKHLGENRDYDVVNSHAWLPGMPYKEIKSLCKKLCVSIHGGGAAPENSLFVSAAHRDRYKKTARYIHNPICIRKYEYKEKKEPYLSFIGRLDRAKGIDSAIRISKQSGIPLKFGGNISDKNYFNTVVKPHLNGHVQYVGQVGGKEKSELLGNSMAVLYPTRLNPEPFGRVPLEANACGTPAIAYRNGGLQEVVKDGVSGFLVRDDRGMLEALKKTTSITPTECRRWVEDNFNETLIATRHLDMYQKLMDGETWG